MGEITKIADVVVPEVFTQYVIDRTTEKNEIMNSGVIVTNPELNKLVTGGGATITMPKWKKLGGRSQPLSDATPLETKKISSRSEVAPLLLRGDSWGVSELAGIHAGDDPMKAIVEQLADYWIADEKKDVLDILEGMFKAADMTGLVYTGNAGINATEVLKAKQLLGDEAGKLSMLYMHSAVLTQLQVQNVIQFIPQSESRVSIPTFLGYRVIVDDSLPVATDTYTTYLLTEGCIQRGVGVPPTMTPTETDRDSLASQDILINRQARVLHPVGMKWKGTPAGDTPTGDELKTGTNWERVADIKDMGIVKMTHKLA